MKLPKSRESGQTMVMALILLAVGSLLVVPMLNQSFTNLGYHQSIECRTLTSYSADSGMQYALTKLYNNPGGYTDPDNPLQESLTLNDRTVNVTAEYQGGGIYDITSVASGGGCGSTTIEAYVNLSAGSFAFAIAAKDYMYIDNTTVDSLPAPGGEANIHSNGDIDLVGAQTVVNGDASAVGIISGWDKVNGEVTFPSPPVQFPGDYSELYEMMAKEGGIWEGPYIITGGTEYLGPLYINGNLIVENATLILEGTVYVTGMISVENGNLDGEQTVVAEGSIRIEQGAVRSDIIPLIISTKVDGEIYSETGTTVDGVLYAPYGSIRLESGVNLYGAVGGKTVNIQGCTITYAKELQGRQDLPGGELVTISYSYK